MSMTPQLTKLAAWQALEAHYPKICEFHLRKLFADDPKRGERMTAEAVGIYLDYSMHRITDETLKLLLQLAEESGLRARMDVMFRGEKINYSNVPGAQHCRDKRFDDRFSAHTYECLDANGSFHPGWEKS